MLLSDGLIPNIRHEAYDQYSTTTYPPSHMYKPCYIQLT